MGKIGRSHSSMGENLDDLIDLPENYAHIISSATFSIIQTFCDELITNDMLKHT